MIRVTLLPPFSEALGSEPAVHGATVFALVRALDALAPGLGTSLEERAAVAVNGAMQADWSAPLPDKAEVLFVPRVAGG